MGTKTKGQLIFVVALNIKCIGIAYRITISIGGGVPEADIFTSLNGLPLKLFILCGSAGCACFGN
jgi:hypothetical protein